MAGRTALGVLLVFGSLMCAPSATAAPDLPPGEPAPIPAPPPPGLVPPMATIGNLLAQNGSAPTGPLGLPDLSAYTSTLLLGQNPTPAAPGVPGPVAIPNLTAFNADFLLPQNAAPAAPGQGTPAPGIGPDADSPGTGRIAFLRRLHEMYQGGELTGAFLGQLPKDQLGEPLPGTDPGPGIYLPPGLGQDLMAAPSADGPPQH